MKEECREGMHKFHQEECCKPRMNPEECCQKEECDFPEKFLKLADEAWKELLKEKIKANIEKDHGAKLDKLAEILTKANKEKWKHKMSAKMKYKEYKESLKEFFTSEH